MKANITATKTATARIVRVEFEDGSSQELVYGVVQGADGKWTLPDPAMVDREVRALLGVVEARQTPVEIPDTDVSSRLASAVEPLPDKTLSF